MKCVCYPCVETVNRMVLLKRTLHHIVLYATENFATLYIVSIPVINIAVMREWERTTWATGQTEAEVIRRVGKRVARRARKLTGEDDGILILAGKGHNGDDARAAKEFLDDRKVKLLELLLPDTDLLALETALKE